MLLGYSIWVLVVACRFFLADKARPVMCNALLCNGIKTDMKQLDWQLQLRSVAISDL